MRKDRKFNELRKIDIKTDYMKNAFSSCLIKFGKTQVICSSTIENKVPRWLKGSGKGWLTAEYAMLPTSTNTRNERESIRGKLSGRTQEIQRLIGRSIRSSINLSFLEEKLIKIDCDVLTADGGTRTASINGAWISLVLAINKLIDQKVLFKNPINFGISAISCGIINDKPYLDLNYDEDSLAEADANFVFNERGDIIEIQCTAEKKSITPENFSAMYKLAKSATKEISFLQNKVIGQKNKSIISNT